jgi:cytochrome c556
MNRSVFSMICPNTLDAAMLAVIVISTFAVAGISQADSHEAAEASVKYRQSVMSGIGTNMGAIGDIMKNRLDLPGAVAIHAGQMADSAALIAPAFKKQISEGATDAKPEIWQDWAKFEEAIATYQQAASDLQRAAAGSDPAAVGPAMRALGKSCGGCHKPFRKPKEESYKNK